MKNYAKNFGVKILRSRVADFVEKVNQHLAIPYYDTFDPRVVVDPSQGSGYYPRLGEFQFRQNKHPIIRLDLRTAPSYPFIPRKDYKNFHPKIILWSTYDGRGDRPSMDRSEWDYTKKGIIEWLHWQIDDYVEEHNRGRHKKNRITKAQVEQMLGVDFKALRKMGKYDVISWFGSFTTSGDRLGIHGIDQSLREAWDEQFDYDLYFYFDRNGFPKPYKSADPYEDWLAQYKK